MTFMIVFMVENELIVTISQAAPEINDSREEFLYVNKAV